MIWVYAGGAGSVGVESRHRLIDSFIDSGIRDEIESIQFVQVFGHVFD